MSLWHREPVVIIGVLQALVTLAVAFGFDLTPQQLGAVVALLAALSALFARQQVTPVVVYPDHEEL